MVVAVVQVVLSTVIALFFLQVIRALLSKSDNSVAGAFEGGLSWLLAA